MPSCRAVFCRGAVQSYSADLVVWYGPRGHDMPIFINAMSMME